jgi:hypothetical protein
MRLTTKYRRNEAGINGAKHHYVDCHIDFTHEERVLIDERGLYDLSIDVPAATPLPTRSDDFSAMLMRVAGIILSPIGLLACSVQALRPAEMVGAGIWPAFMLIAGIGLFTIGKLKDIQADRRQDDPEQHFTLRKLLINPDFIVHAYTVDQARQFEDDVRQTLSAIAERVRENAAVPTQTSYEL